MFPEQPPDLPGMIAAESAMKPLAAAVLGFTVLGSGVFLAQSNEPVDVAAIERIRDEGFNRSQVMETAFWLTDRFGPRLNGSPEHEEAGDWVVERLRSWGLQNVRKERFRSGRGWSLVNFHATMLEPRVMPIIGMPRAWTVGTEGVVRAELVRPLITSEADAAAYRGRLRGRIVLTQPVRQVRMLEYGDGFVARYEDQDGRWRREAMTPQPAQPAPSAAPARPAVAPAQPAFDLMRFYREEGVVALLDYGAATDMAQGGSNLSWRHQRPDGGTLFVQAGASAYDDPANGLPRVTVAVEHYNRMLRLVERGIPVRVELNVDVRFRQESADSPNGFNVIGEIPGTDKADEIVLIGAHLDSWHGATGATDNASGVSAMMEVVRILTATGLKPRRTIRIALWGNEESGLLGSRAYAAAHLGTPADPKPGLKATTAYFNLDNGTGPIRGVWMQGNQHVAPIFETWAKALGDLQVDLLSPRGVSSTDHVPFDELGVPAFQFVQERYEYTSRTHHSTMDFYDRLQPGDLTRTAVVATVFAWHAATRELPLPRRNGQP
jgi:carboxypeptidase Q